MSSDGMRSLRRPVSSWEDNIKMDLEEIGWKGIDRFHLACGGLL
jgi:hypothetical protein